MVMAYIVLAYIAMASIAMAYIVMAYIIMVSERGFAGKFEYNSAPRRQQGIGPSHVAVICMTRCDHQMHATKAQIQRDGQNARQICKLENQNSPSCFVHLKTKMERTPGKGVWGMDTRRKAKGDWVADVFTKAKKSLSLIAVLCDGKM